jgi:hypothetical protein
MIRSQLTASAERLLERFRSVGGVVEYAAWEFEGGIVEDAHRSAVVQTVEQLAIANEPERAVATPIGLAEFVGPLYDFSCGCLILNAVFHDVAYRDLTYSGGADYRRVCDGRPVRLPSSSGGDYLTNGYAQAFTEPPHGLSSKLEPSEIDELFRALNQELFGSLGDHLSIQAWSTDWSGYFQPGQEWWGSFLWSVHWPARQRIVVVAASTTD